MRIRKFPLKKTYQTHNINLRFLLVDKILTTKKTKLRSRYFRFEVHPFYGILFEARYPELYKKCTRDFTELNLNEIKKVFIGKI